MLFNNVSIAGLAHIDAPCTLTSQEINARLQPMLERIGIKSDVFADIVGINARRLWNTNVQTSDVATMAARKALQDAGVAVDRIGLVVNTSVSRDYLEPSTASIVSGNLGVGEQCIAFDVANACLAFLNGMDIAGQMLERGDIDYALVVNAETANRVYEKTLERMSAPGVTEQEFREEMAALTLGCGAVAMVLARTALVPDAPQYKGGVTRSATEWNKLCCGNLDRMVTDTRLMLIEGIKLAKKTFVVAKQVLGWAVEELDQFVIHQVSRPHTEAFIKSFGIDPAKVMTIFREYGNIGPASVPIVLSKLKELGRLKKGDRIALLGIGSGLNCSMAEVVW
ncbi:3-oxoacyl-ACP synthase III [Xylella fastidiosa subsp. morus]|jgi:3-oxoacyl-[acyl-carrier-protein] synthase-3|uniref:3-oxoacyl-[ACP] synthase III n=6 Tax=Xylella fastidiosa TaxID=2371 RepID=Q87D54_XYLFT|nr:3-oxoacyl-ACP synthase III [Xylella fastidiosa]ADN63849.1 3-oxoacyl-(acyl carrier protein) synthase III [Xylella fastidiosa subsp. fastidiosa GB514]KAF0572021.1 3-oxoacyl-ACP synthase [Xylella fastidiosa subsp. fastidiosa Mus-1]AAF84772.1 3-oxoacyl-[ACP] synthase III [Xylella fastidiosa 9a5c]AAO28700.1 3-oxoacyl-[ACP] synthase III [Xylella fastidiosa Temecula1]ACB92316.1 Beta-ketoacyl-acyl-carrier-protein synthase I [Xylella fastidiosa M23]